MQRLGGIGAGWIEAKRKGKERAPDVLKQTEIEKDTHSAKFKVLGNELGAAIARHEAALSDARVAEEAHDRILQEALQEAKAGWSDTRKYRLF